MYCDDKLDQNTDHPDGISVVHCYKKLDQDMDHPDRISVVYQYHHCINTRATQY